MLLRILSLILLPISLFASVAIEQLCDQYKRPFTILSIDADDGEQEILLAKQFEHATVVMTEKDRGIENKKATALVEKVKEIPRLDNIVILDCVMTAQNLELLATSEYFDIIITPSKENLSTLKKMSHYIICGGEWIDGNIKDKMERLPLFREHGPKTSYKISFNQIQSFEVSSKTPQTHAIMKCPGISLITFFALRGLYPEKIDIVSQLQNRSIRTYFKHATPWNTIVSGNQINFNTAPNRRTPKKNPKSPTLWEIWDEFFSCQSKREMQELIEERYLDDTPT